MKIALAALILFGLLTGRAALAQTALCDSLPPDKKPAVQELLAALHPYDGCDDTFARCLASKPVKPVVVRLANELCRQVKAGKTRREIESLLVKRAQTLFPTGPRAPIALDESVRAGAANAPVTVVVYACARCPFCKLMVPALHAAVTDGRLAGKVSLYLRPFPLKSHPGSTEGGLAFLAAAKLGRYWPFVLLSYARFDAFAATALPEWAEAVGMARPAFERLTADPKLRDELVAAKQEGLRNKVNATPMLFINGHPYLYELTPEAVLDVLEEAHETATVARK